MQTFHRSPHKWGSPYSRRQSRSKLSTAPATNQLHFHFPGNLSTRYVWYVIVWGEVWTCGALMCADVWMVRFSQEVQTLRPGIVWSGIGIRLRRRSRRRRRRRGRRRRGRRRRRLPPGGWRSRREPWRTAPLVQRCPSRHQFWIITFSEPSFEIVIKPDRWFSTGDTIAILTPFEADISSVLLINASYWCATNTHFPSLLCSDSPCLVR